MPLFDYKAKTQNGELIDERIDASSKAEAIVEIQNKRLILLDIQEVKATQKSSFTRNHVSPKELALFCKQLGQLIETGISIHHGIELVGEQHKNKFFKDVLMMVVRDIKGGTSISRSLEKHPKVFPDIMIYQMRAAEEGGFLPRTLKSLSQEFVREADFKKKIRGAFMYPIFVVFVTIAIVWFMMTKIIPTLAETLTSFDAEIPAITQIVMNVSKGFQNYWVMGLVGIFAFIACAIFLLKHPVYRLTIDRMLMKIPLIGNLISVINVARIARVTSSLMSSGVGIDQTLNNVNQILTNKAMREAMVDVKDEVINRGQTLHYAFEKYSYFPKTFVQIVKIGEEAGNLSEVLEQLAEQYEEEVQDTLKAVTAAINPILMLIIGAIVGVIVISMFLPMFSLMGSF